MTIELAIALLSLATATSALAVATFKRRKPSLAAAVARGVAYGNAMGKTPEEKLRHAIAAIQKEDLGDNGKRDWPDSTIRFAVEALIQNAK